MKIQALATKNAIMRLNRNSGYLIIMTHLGVFIGRFQPFHHGHLKSVLSALESCEKLLIIIGSTHRARNVRNPFTYEERRQMLIDNFLHYDGEHGTNITDRIEIEGARDYLYEDTPWMKEISALIQKYAKNHRPFDKLRDPHLENTKNPEPVEGASISIVGFDKDHSTYYLNIFPEYGRIPIENFDNLNATPMRHHYFQQDDHAQEALPDATQQFLAQFKFHEAYQTLKEEYLFMVAYQASWAASPYPPIYVTCDSVVICQDHILLIQRKDNPGKGLWALPGGFLEEKERLIDSLIRELIEETQIDVSIPELKSNIKHMRVFDHPERSLIGRVLTHAGLIKLDHPQLPNVQADDDALDAKWWPLEELSFLEDKLHDDHFQIINMLLKA